MDASPSGEEVVIKTRKPYTITKQRERWTEEEHNRFLEAIKLYGRAWQRSEEHIGTKTAVQIRSHAQKFFSKLEKEALAKGVAVGQTLDIDIPPPRPKRKPSNPYPRKSGAGIPTSQVGAKDGNGSTSSSSLCKQGLDMEKEPILQRPNGDEKLTDRKQNQDDKFSQFPNFIQEPIGSSVSSANENFPNTGLLCSCTLREFVPSLKEDNGTNKALNPDMTKPSDEKSDKGKKRYDLTGVLATDEMLASSNHPMNVPVQFVNGSLDTCTQIPSADVSFQERVFQPINGCHGFPNTYANPAASTNIENPNNAPRPSIHHSPLSVHSPFTPAHLHQNDYRSFLHISSTFANLIVSSLLQNPAAHAAASFAASFWPHASLETSADSSGCNQGRIPPQQMISPPSIAAIAAATAAAATAWWAAHGLLPLCAPLHSAYTYSPASATAVPSMDTGQASSSKAERRDKASQNPSLQDQQLDREHSEARKTQYLDPKSPAVSSSHSEGSGGTNPTTEAKDAEPEKVAEQPELHDSNKTMTRKQVDRSSSGSNTPSSSEVWTDARENCENGKENSKAPENDHPPGEPNNRCRSVSNINDPWKEVSEEGRLAFQALFSREILPQSFLYPPDQQSGGLKEEENTEEKTQKACKDNGNAILLDLNSKTGGSSDSNQADMACDDNNSEDRLQTIGLANGKLKSCWTGFQPYKRCSVEAKENRAKVRSQAEEKGTKRTRLEGEAST